MFNSTTMQNINLKFIIFFTGKNDKCVGPDR